ncbi:MAG: WYL domain-containing protein [Paludibacteraceae bacterium]|nr:WYL domain-containing protein [Paludibacteraceae bacterium]
MAAKTVKMAVWLISILKKSDLTLKELQEEFRKSSLYDGKELQDRTFRNYMDMIREEFGLNITCTKITTGMHVYRIPDEECDIDEIKQFTIDYFTICNTLEANGDSAKVRNRILFQKVDTGSKFLVDIIKAMVDSVVIEVHYEKFDGSTSDRLLEPFFLKVFENRWYLVAREVLPEGELRNKSNKHKFKTFSLDKVTALKLTNKKFKYDFNKNPETYFSDSFGIFVNEGAPMEITLKFTGDAIKFVKNRPLHHTQVETYSSPNMYVVKVKVNPSKDFVNALLSYGPGVEVIAPASFRETFAESVKQMYSNYFDDKGDLKTLV